MAVSLEIRIGYLLPELLAHTFVILGTLSATRTISARPFKSFADCFYDFFVFVKSNHNIII